MNKILVFLFILSLGMVACGGRAVDKVAYVEIVVSDTKNISADAAVVHLRLTPNYKKKTIAVNYVKNFTKVKSDVVIDGTLGLEDYDRFNKTVEMVATYSSKKKPIVASGGKIPFYVKVVDFSGNSIDMKAEDNETDKTLEFLRGFYLDVVNLLTEDEKI